MTPNPQLLAQTSRVAFAALIHDLGKFSQRADVDTKGILEMLQARFCPTDKFGQSAGYTHKHAAYTALSLDDLSGLFPSMTEGDVSPFSAANPAAPFEGDGTLLAAAASHHDPKTLLGRIITAADRISSGFEREEYLSAESDERDGQKGQTKRSVPGSRGFLETRLRAAAEELSAEPRPIEIGTLKKAFRLRPLAPAAIFPVALSDAEPDTRAEAKAEYGKLWAAFVGALSDKENGIPAAFRKNLPLWLDAFDTAWLTFTATIPSATAFRVIPDVSLYDHSKATAALAAALWRWEIESGRSEVQCMRAYRNRSDYDVKKILLIKGELIGADSILFAEGRGANRSAAKLLRGRACYVSLLSELAVTRVLDVLSLPTTSAIICEGGRFLIAAHNTEEVRKALDDLQAEFDDWFIRETLGTASIQLASVPASCRDFSAECYGRLSETLERRMAVGRLHRFDLAHRREPLLRRDWSYGVCRWNGSLPADGLEDGESAARSRDEVKIGDMLTSADTLLIVRDGDVPAGAAFTVCEVPVFGYRAVFADRADALGTDPAKIVRCLDLTLPENQEDVLWHGLARRCIGARVPRYTDEDVAENTPHAEDDRPRVGSIKSFGTLAAGCLKDGVGTAALMACVIRTDRIERLLEKGLIGNAADEGKAMTFAKAAGLARQFDAFFTAYLPALCAEVFPNVYTVTSQSRGLLLIGPWREVERTAARLQKDFMRFAAENPDITLSGGLAIAKPGIPVPAMRQFAETALDKSVSAGGNHVTVFGRTVPWVLLERFDDLERQIVAAAGKYGVTSSLLYRIYLLLDMAADTENPEASMWRSRFFYTVTRHFEEACRTSQIDAREARDEFTRTVYAAISLYRDAVRIPFTNLFYSVRRRG